MKTEDVMQESYLTPNSDVKKDGLGEDKMDPIMKFNLNVTNIVRKVYYFTMKICMSNLKISY